MGRRQTRSPDPSVLVTETMSLDIAYMTFYNLVASCDDAYSRIRHEVTITDRHEKNNDYDSNEEETIQDIHSIQICMILSMTQFKLLQLLSCTIFPTKLYDTLNFFCTMIPLCWSPTSPALL